MIKLEKLCCGYGRKEIVHEVTTIFEKNRITAVVGPNGCGKSTLLKSIVGILKSKSGRIIIDGKELNEYKKPELAKKITLLPQMRHVPYMKVEDLIMCARYPYLGMNKTPDEDDLHAVTDAMSITDTLQFKDEYVKKLSGGQRQKVYIAMTLAQRTDIILFDEPTTYLDMEKQFEILDLIEILKNSGKTVVMVVHDLAYALKYADDIVVMSEGKIVQCGSVREIIESGILEEIYMIKVNKVLLDGKEEYVMTKGRETI